MKLENRELEKTIGGGWNVGLGLLVGGIITFFIGLVDGYVRPLACR